MKKILKNILANFGYEVRRKNINSHGSVLNVGNTMSMAMKRLIETGINPRTVVDVGAASGMWTRKAIEYWPNACFTLIEPLEEQVPQLIDLASEFTNISYHTGVAGSNIGSVYFSVTPDLDGSGVYGKSAANVRELPVLTVDSITEGQDSPFLIKLDTHGYEVPILEGARETLKSTEALIIEVYGFYVSPTALLFHQLSSWLEKRGFRLFDIVDVMRREKDSAFWQADAIYLRADHPIFEDNNYR